MSTPRTTATSTVEGRMKADVAGVRKQKRRKIIHQQIKKAKKVVY